MRIFNTIERMYGGIHCAGSMELPKGRAPRLGVILMVASLLLWIGLPVIPFLPIEGGTKVTLATGQLILAEVIFWAGAGIAGPEAARRIRMWRRKPDRQNDFPEADGGGAE